MIGRQRWRSWAGFDGGRGQGSAQAMGGALRRAGSEVTEIDPDQALAGGAGAMEGFKGRSTRERRPADKGRNSSSRPPGNQKAIHSARATWRAIFVFGRR